MTKDIGVDPSVCVNISDILPTDEAIIPCEFCGDAFPESCVTLHQVCTMSMCMYILPNHEPRAQEKGQLE